MATHLPDPLPAAHLSRQLGMCGLWLLMINGMIGAGLFGIPAGAAAAAGGFSPLVFLLCALLIAPVMLCFAELASATGENGGPARYVGAAFGPVAGFQTGWALYVARMTAFAANLNLLVSTLAHLWPALQLPLLRITSLGALTALLAWVNIVGVRPAMRSLGGLTVLKLTPLLLLIGLGLFALHDSTAPAQTALAWWPAAESTPGAAFLLVIYVYVGFEAGLIPGGEARHPQRDMPRALLLALSLSALLYVLLQWICLQWVPDLAQQSRPVVALGTALLGELGATLVVGTIVASVGANLLGSMFSAPRISHALAAQGQLPTSLAAVHPRHRTPHRSIALYAVLAWVLAASGSFIWLAGLSVLTRILIYLACIASLPHTRQHAPAGSLRLPWGWAIPGLAVAACVWLLSQVDGLSVLATAGLLAAGSGLYALTRRKL